MTALTLYATTQIDSLLPNAAQALPSTGASGSTTNHTNIGTNSGWGELGFGGNPTWAAGSSPGPANGYGCIYDSAALEGQTIAAGTWTLKTNVKTSAGTETGVLELMVYKYNANASAYTLIGTISIASATYTTSGTNVSISGSLGAASFGSGDKLYWELWFDSTSHSGTPVNMLVTTSNSNTQGFAGAGELDTPGYAPTGNPGLATSPTSLGFSAIMGGANPASQSDTLSETNGYATNWTSSISYGSGSGWLSLSPTSGSLSANGSQTISVSCATGSLAAGTYTAMITFTATTGGTQATISVTFTVSPRPVLSPSPTSLSFSANAGGANPTGQQSTLSETAGTATAWTSSISYGSGSGWLSISPTAGNLVANGNAIISVSCVTGSLVAGTYTATITFTATTGGNTASVSVTFLVIAPGPPPASNQTLSARDGKMTLYARNGKATLTARGN